MPQVKSVLKSSQLRHPVQLLWLRHFSRQIPAVGHWAYCDENRIYRLNDGILDASVFLLAQADPAFLAVRVAFFTADDYSLSTLCMRFPLVEAHEVYSGWCRWLANLGVAEHDVLQSVYGMVSD